MNISLDAPLSLAALRSVYETPTTLTLSPAARTRVAAGAQVIAKIVASGATVYGVNTGFGLLANKVVGASDLEALQRNVDSTRDLGFVKSALDVKQKADLSIVEEAAKRLK